MLKCGSLMWGFQSTHPRGVRLSFARLIVTPFTFQSTHPRGVRPLALQVGLDLVVDFNPRTREGCDCSISIHSGDSIRISIHAPARGATAGYGICRQRDRYFNPRTREGCDYAKNQIDERKGAFQSTHPRGVRQGRQTLKAAAFLFQSTHPRGVRRGSNPNQPYSHQAFQSTHPRGVRHREDRFLPVRYHISIHAPARGATSGG